MCVFEQRRARISCWFCFDFPSCTSIVWKCQVGKKQKKMKQTLQKCKQSQTTNVINPFFSSFFWCSVLHFNSSFLWDFQFFSLSFFRYDDVIWFDWDSFFRTKLYLKKMHQFQLNWENKRILIEYSESRRVLMRIKNRKNHLLFYLKICIFISHFLAFFFLRLFCVSLLVNLYVEYSANSILYSKKVTLKSL